MKLRRNSLVVNFLLLLMTNLFFEVIHSQSIRSLMNEGNNAYKAQNFAEAQSEYNKANALKPSFNGQFNEANALFQQNKYKEAAELNMAALGQAKNNKEKAMASYNLGNSFYKSQDFNKAIDAYKQSLRLDPSDIDAKKNLTKAIEKKKQQSQKDQKQQQEQKDKKDDKQSQADQKENQKNDSGDPSQQDSDQEPKSPEEQKSQKDQEGKPKSLTRQEAENMLRIMKQEEQKTRAKLMKQQRPEERSSGKDW